MISQLMLLLHKDPVQALAIWAGLQYAFSAFVDSLPQPKPLGSQLYQFGFSFAHRLAGNLTRDTQPKITPPIGTS